MQKDREVIHMSIKMREIQSDIRRKDEKIFELENELISYKANFSTK